jgi:hypothetical protein
LNGAAVHRTSMPLFMLARAVCARTACAEGSARSHGHDDQKCVAPLVAMLVSRAAEAAGPIEISSTRPVAALNRKKPGINETTAEKATAAKRRCRRSTTGVRRCPLWCAFRTRVGHRVRSEKSHKRPPTSSARSGRDGGTTRPIARLEASARHRQRRVAAKLRGVVVARGVVVVKRRLRRCVGPTRNGVALAGTNDDMSRVMHRRGTGRRAQGDQQA